MEQKQSKPNQPHTQTISVKPEARAEQHVEYAELSDAELEVVCGGDNLIGRRK